MMNDDENTGQSAAKQDSEDSSKENKAGQNEDQKADTQPPNAPAETQQNIQGTAEASAAQEDKDGLPPARRGAAKKPPATAKNKKLAAELAAEGGTLEEQERGAATKKAQQERRKKQRKLMIYGGGGFLLILLIYYLFKPFEGGITYGICKTFLELQVRYPDKIRLSSVDDFGDSVRIWYTSLDSFGEYRLQPIRCFFASDAQRGLHLRKVEMNRQILDQTEVERFNAAIPALIQNPPDLTLPTALPDSLRDLQINPDQFRRPVF